MPRSKPRDARSPPIRKSKKVKQVDWMRALTLAIGASGGGLDEPEQARRRAIATAYAEGLVRDGVVTFNAQPSAARQAPARSTGVAPPPSLSGATPAKPPAVSRKVALLKRMRFGDPGEGVSEGPNNGLDQKDILPPGSPELAGRRILRPRRKAEPLIDSVADPTVAARLIDAPPAAIGWKRTTRKRVATAYGFLHEQHNKKSGSKVEVVGNAVPPMLLSPQTALLIEAYKDLDPALAADADFDLFLFEEPDKGAKDKDRHAPPLQGPHTVAHIALATGLKNIRENAVAKSKSPNRQNDLLRQAVDKLMAVGDVQTPRDVREILMEEEPALWDPMSTAENPVFADGVEQDRQRRVSSYSNAYTEMYNQVIALMGYVSDLSLEPTPPGKLRAALDAAFDRVEELMNLHPFQSYGWRQEDAVISKGEIGGKGEGGSKNKLFGIAKLKKGVALEDSQLEGLEKLIDGIDPDRMFADPERYRAFLVSRIELFVGDESGKPANQRVLGKYEADDLFDMIIDRKIEKEPPAKKARTKGASGSKQ